MRRPKLIMHAIIVLMCTHISAVVIVVHGSFASTTSWAQPHGVFFKELEHQAQQLGHHVVTFCWSGIPTDQEIIKGGTMLAQLITSYSATEKIITVGHSHGGNVINIASQLLYKLNQQQQPLMLTQINPIVLEYPIFVTEATQHLLTTTKKNTFAQNIAMNKQEFQSLFNQALFELKDWFSKFLTRDKTISSIEFSYLLGTPVDMAKYSPNMSVIKKMILFYSDGDWVQPVLGMFQRMYPPHECRANVKVTLHGSGNHGALNSCDTAPSHTNLHHPLIGKWLLCIPEILEQLKLGSFGNFKFGVNGTINFDAIKEPNYFS